MSGIPGMGSEDRSIIELLAIIARNTGGLDDDDPQLPQGTRPIDPEQLVITETADLNGTNPDGTVTIEPGEDEVIARDEAGTGLVLLAAGATDEDDTHYYIRVDYDRTVGGTRHSPLGTINTPFSFTEMYGGMIVAEHTVEYRARVSEDASGPVDIAGRLHLEVL